MSGFNWAGAAAGVVDERRRQRDEAREEARLALARDEIELRRRALEAELGASADARTRAAEQQRMESAKVVSGLLAPGAITAEQAAMLRGTPYGVALLEDKRTLPATSTPGVGPSGGGESYTAFTGTPQQRQEVGRRAALDSLAQDQTLSPSIRRFLELREAGVNLPNPESLESPVEREAEAARHRELEFADFQRRSSYTDQLIRGRQRAPLVGRLVTPQNRLQARRWAQQDAVDRYEAMKDDFGSVPEGVSLEELAADLEAEYLGELDPSYKRPPRQRNATQALENLQQVFPGGRAAGSRQTPTVGTLVPNTSAKTITRAELKATAQRLGMTEQQAEAEARKRGFSVR